MTDAMPDPPGLAPQAGRPDRLPEPVPPPELPSGTVTFVMTDIEASTELVAQLGEQYPAVLLEHRDVLRQTFEAYGGQQVEAVGDAVLAVFPRATDAVAAARASQLAVARRRWPAEAALRVRTGLHTGEPILARDEYVGLDVHRVARLCAAAHGGQILLSEVTQALLEHDMPAGWVRDLGRHHLKGLPQSERIFQLLDSELAADFPPLRSLAEALHNLPRELTSFVGRQREMETVARLLNRTALLTLTGPGGAGKTRLALRVASDRVADHIDGVWLVELAAVTDPALVPQVVASAIGLRQEPGRPLMASLLAYLRARQVLLVLDNCEHLIAACAELAETLLRSCPSLQILATSREPLAIGAEVAWVVPPLATPDLEPRTGLPPDPADLAESEAVRLFVERAAAARPSFTVSAANGLVLARICQQLDGIPLAIELAAARVNAFSVEQIAARLHDRFRLLTGGSRAALPRHRTLWALVEWSHDLLTESERLLVRRLAVFAGGWTLEAAEAVAGPDEDVLNLLGRLVDKSLVLMDPAGDQPRYEMLETIRQFAWQQLCEAGEERETRGRHQAWFQLLAEQVGAQIWGAEQVGALDRLESEHDNLRAALAWCLETGEAVAGLRIAAALWRFWDIRGYLGEGQATLARFLALAPEPSPVRARALAGAAFLSLVLGEAEAARAYAEEGLALARETGELASMSLALTPFVLQATTPEAVRQVGGLLQECLARSTEAGSAFGQATALYWLGVLAAALGDLQQAEAHLERSLATLEPTGDRWASAHPMARLAHLALLRGDQAQATARYRTALLARLALGDARSIPLCLDGLAWVACAEGRVERAARLLGAEEALRERVGAIVPAVIKTEHERAAATVRASLPEPALAALWQEGRSMVLPQAVAYALEEPASP